MAHLGPMMRQPQPGYHPAGMTTHQPPSAISQPIHNNHHPSSQQHRPSSANTAPAQPQATAAPIRGAHEPTVGDIITDTSQAKAAAARNPNNPSNSTYIKQYKKGKFLGKGGFAYVYELTSCDSNRHYAGKVVAKSSITKPSSKQKLLNEIRIHRQLNHPYIVRFERFFEDKANVYILLELCPQQTLMELIKRRKRLTELETQCYMYQLVEAVAHLHNNNVIHRDLKLGNLFISDSGMELKVGDFGLATKLEYPEERKKTLCGTPNYIAPEILDNNNQQGHSFEVDVWALGVIMYTLLVGSPPFETESVKTTYRRIRDNIYEFPPHVTVSSRAKSLIQRILHSDPQQRPSLQSIQQDEFFTAQSFPKRLPSSILHTPYVPTASDNEAVQNENAQPNVMPVSNGKLFDAGVVKKSASSDLVPTPTATTERRAVADKAPAPLAALSQQPLSSRRHNADTQQTAAGTVTSAQTIANSQPPSQRTTRYSTLTSTKAPLPTVNATAASAAVNVRPQQPAVSATAEHNIEPPVAARITAHKHAPSNIPLNAAANADEDSDNDSEDQQQYKQIQQEIERSFIAPSHQSNQQASSNKPLPTLTPAPLYVTQWVDYSNKYGIGYLLSNNTTGMYFNDATKIVLHHNQVDVTYYERNSSSSATTVPSQHYTINQYPLHLQKKITLIKHFHGYLMNQAQKRGLQMDQLTVQTSSMSLNGNTDVVYIKKWMKTKHATFFRLSNRTVQVQFEDATEVLIDPAANTVTYTDKTNIRSCYALDTSAIPSQQVRPDLAKRMKYTQEILQHLTMNTATPTEAVSR